MKLFLIYIENWGPDGGGNCYIWKEPEVVVWAESAGSALEIARESDRKWRCKSPRDELRAEEIALLNPQ